MGTGSNAAPTLSLNASATWVGHEDVLTLTADATDEDGDPITITWLMAKDQSVDDGHDHDHGSGADQGDSFGIPEETGKTGEQAEFTFTESGTYRLVARAQDPKGGESEESVDIKVTQSVPKTTFTFVKEETLAAGTGGEEGASLLLYDLMQPSQNTYIDSARYDVRLLYPGEGTFSLDWSSSAAPADLDAYLFDGSGELIAALNQADPAGTTEETTVELKDGSYTIEVYARAGANVPYTLTLDLDLLIPGLTVTEDGHGDGHDHAH